MSSRTALASPIPVNASYDRTSAADRRKNMSSAVVPPPRTSSQQPPSGSGGGSGSRKSSQGGDRSTSQRYGGPDANGQVAASQSYQDETSSRSRRTGHSSSHDKASSGHRESSRTAASQTSMPIRSQQAGPSSSSQGPSREASEILNSVLVSPSEVDIDRERERVAMSQPTQSAAIDDATPPAISAGEQHGEESRRGGRSRHDFSKREKHTKFGEYILGNTIGEGEFGKVKLGWKQEGGVQVSTVFIRDAKGHTELTPSSRRSPSSSSRRTSLAAIHLG